MSKPYTYLIGWSKQQKFYYGVRYSKKCTPEDLWKTYFTSSPVVHECREKYGEPDIIQVRQTFKNEYHARNWEYKVLQKMNVVLREDFLNKHDAPCPPVRYGKRPKSVGEKISKKLKGKQKTHQHKKKVSEGVKRYYQYKPGPFTRKKHSLESREIIRKKRAKQIITDETKEKMSLNHVGMRGKNHSESSKKKLSDANKGLKMFNNGIVNKKFFPGTEPKEFVPGSINRRKK